MEHPKWIKKYVHKSKINAVHIVNWEDHHHIATIPHVYAHNGEKSEGAQAADLIVVAPELLQFAKDIKRYLLAGTIETESDRDFVIMRVDELLEATS